MTPPEQTCLAYIIVSVDYFPGKVYLFICFLAMSTIEIILLKNDLHKAIWTGDGIVPLLHSFINKTTHAHFIYETRGVTIKIQELFYCKHSYTLTA